MHNFVCIQYYIVVTAVYTRVCKKKKKTNFLNPYNIDHNIILIVRGGGREQLLSKSWCNFIEKNEP